MTNLASLAAPTRVNDLKTCVKPPPDPRRVVAMMPLEVVECSVMVEVTSGTPDVGIVSLLPTSTVTVYGAFFARSAYDETRAG
jgi:hypothetical protein